MTCGRRVKGPPPKNSIGQNKDKGNEYPIRIHHGIILNWRKIPRQRREPNLGPLSQQIQTKI